MHKLESNELMNIKGGISGWLVAGLIAAGIFAVGVFDGIARPLKCR